MNKKKFNRGFTLIEVVVAASVSAMFFGGLLYFAATTRTETSKADRYLRALQIAQETMDLIQSTAADQLTAAGMQIFEGSLVDPQTGKSVTFPINAGSPWQPDTRGYSEQYVQAFYYRKVRLEPVAAGVPNARFMRQATVEVFWNEGKAPEQIEAVSGNPNRMRKLVLKGVIFNEQEPY